MIAASSSTAANARAGALGAGRVGAALPFVYGAAAVTWIASDRGGYYATSWSWTALAGFLVCAFALTLARRVRLRRLDLVLLGGYGAYAAWTFASVIWSRSVPSTLDAGTRALAYLALLAAALSLTRAASARHLLGGVLTGGVLVCLYALGTRILPDRLGAFDPSAGGYRLSVPVTYWNGLGIFAVMAVLLALTFALRGHGVAVRAAAAAPLPLLLATVYYTFSRGAWLSLAVGLAVAVAADRDRVQLTSAAAGLGAPGAIAVWLASRPAALRVRSSSFAAATAAGHRLLPWLLLLVVASAGVAAGAWFTEQRLPTSTRRSLRTAWLVVLAAVLIGGIAVGWAAKGSPVHEARVIWADVHKRPRKSTANVASRVFDLSPHGRFRLWGAAWSSFVDHPIVGQGGGTFWETWAASPRRAFEAKDTHNLYMQTLSELGLVGLGLLGLGLLTPIAAAFRHRGRLTAGALAVYCAWLVHGAVDWDWQLVGVSAVGVLVGVALVVQARPHSLAPTRALRWPLAGVAVALAVIAFCAVMANVSYARATRSLSRGAYTAADHDARKAEQWNPWSSSGWALRASVANIRGQRGAARADLLEAVKRDPHDWTLQLQLAFAAAGSQRARAFAAARRLAPTIAPTRLPSSLVRNRSAGR